LHVNTTDELAKLELTKLVHLSQSAETKPSNSLKKYIKERTTHTYCTFLHM